MTTFKDPFMVTTCTYLSFCLNIFINFSYPIRPNISTSCRHHFTCIFLPDEPDVACLQSMRHYIILDLQNIRVKQYFSLLCFEGTREPTCCSVTCSGKPRIMMVSFPGTARQSSVSLPGDSARNLLDPGLRSRSRDLRGDQRLLRSRLGSR